MHDALMTLMKWTMTASAVGVAAMAITPLLRKRYASRGLYMLWLVVIAAFLIPIRLPAGENAVTIEVPQAITQPIALRPLSEETKVETVQVTLAPVQREMEEARVAWPEITPAQAIFALYLIGVAGMLGVKAAKHARFMRTVRRWSVPVEEGDVLALYEKAQRGVGVKKVPALLWCEAIESPMLVGMLRARILLPADAPQGDALELVLRHELVHYRRGDLALKALCLAAGALHWFNPFSHLAQRMTNVYCELSCDEQAMHRASLNERALYSQTILSALRRRPTAASALTTHFSADKKTLKRRLTQIMDMHAKKRGVAFALCAVILTLAISSSFALASTKDASSQNAVVWNETPMTAEEMLAIYDESFKKMGTTSSAYHTPEEIVDQADLETWLVEFEKEYKENTGRDRKEDLVVSSTPGAHDMPYDEALQYAKKMLMDKYGTPEEELDAMGVYPRFMDYVYMENESEWEFYFTPRRDCDIDEDHDYPVGGEYRAHFTARSGEEVLCLWYIDDFWPYAQRTWDAGKHDVVYEQYKKTSFYQQSIEDQQYYLNLLKEAGYNVDVERNILQGIELDMMYAETEESVLQSENAHMLTALEEMEKTYGLDRETLAYCGYGAFYSPLQTGTVDVCFAFNYNIVSEMELAREGVGAGVWQNRAAYFPNRLGLFMVRINPQTGKVVSTAHKPKFPNEEDAADAKLLAKRNWTAADLTEYHKLVDELIPQAVAAAEPNWNAHEIAVHTLLREWGADENQFPARAPSEGEITYEKAIEIAVAAVKKEENLTDEAYESLYQSADGSYDYTIPAYDLFVFSFIVDGENVAPDYYVRIDANTGEILEFKIAVGNG